MRTMSETPVPSVTATVLRTRANSRETSAREPPVWVIETAPNWLLTTAAPSWPPGTDRVPSLMISARCYRRTGAEIEIFCAGHVDRDVPDSSWGGLALAQEFDVVEVA